MAARQETSSRRTLSLCLGGDVMTGRGIDQILAHPGDPGLREAWVESALAYVRLAEAASGPIPRPVPDAYLWGDALDMLAARAPELFIVNLETSITTSADWEPKGINYRMHPANVGCLTAAGIDCCALANNHVLDWGRAGLRETLATLDAAGIARAGAGRDAEAAWAPAVLAVPDKARVLVFALGLETSGIPRDWAAGPRRPGVARLEALDAAAVARLAERIRAQRRPGDLVVVSIHWGGNWGYTVAAEQRAFAHALVDAAGVDVVHGHSSHHPLGFEIHRGRPILYGCGDLINDYEGIPGYEEYRGDLGLLWFLDLDFDLDLEADRGRLAALTMAPLRRRRLRLERAEPEAAEWLRAVLERESRAGGIRVALGAGGWLAADWPR
ncbi:MAG: putative polyglutamine synthesis accessory protein [Porticoccaceae bacterium]